MKMTLAVTERESVYTVTTNLGVIVAWERKFKRKASQLGDGIGVDNEPVNPTTEAHTTTL